MMINIASAFNKNTFNSQKKAMFYTVTGSLFLIAAMQTASAEICAPDVSYITPKLNDKNSLNGTPNMKETIDGSNDIDNVIGLVKWRSDMCSKQASTKEDSEDCILKGDERVKQLNCIKNGGQVATSSEGFDVNGNYKGSSQLASNKKSKSGKGNNQEQVTSANSNENNTNNPESNNAESSDAKSKGKEFAKDEKRLHANACVSVIRKKGSGPAFKNICPYPIEVIWCANSKEDPNQCDRGWYGQWSFGVGHVEPINAVYTTTHWVFSACKGTNSIYTNDEMKQKRQLRCVNWKN